MSCIGIELMRYQINLVNAPNQEFSANLKDDDGNFWALDMKLRTYENGALSCDISINGELVRAGQFCNNKMPLIGKKNIIQGNIYFEDQYGNDNPSYEGFNDRFLLIYDTEYRLG